MQPLGHMQAGGGIMGIGPAKYAANMEVATGKSIQDLFDFFAGTSAGAINCGLYACGFSGAEVLEFHHAHGAKIFADKNWRYRLIKCGPRFDDKAILNLLKKFCGDRKMSETVKPLYITAWDMLTKQLKVFGPGDKDVPVWYAIRCSMAAPTYFGNVDGRYADGGMAANDPVLVGFAGAATNGNIDTSNGMRLLNLVTSGETPDRTTPIGNDWLITTYLAAVILPALTSGNSADMEFIRYAINKFAQSVSSRGEPLLQNFRVAPDCPDYDLADTKCAQDVEARWDRQFQLDRDGLVQYLTGTAARDDAGPEDLTA